ncbi:hypothetical protein [Gluconobacter cerinus]|uniref:Lipoprotein n=1 Tax=Gluconobacter cerinus TaxID=38307 RepID=A0AAV5NHY8_9PROT|nr:hypothetical protein [Gluconobacter cerinus]MBS1023234.1 hypothetical protein [Gluconobacter cerinus]GLQ63989.1 hypothetical protein GCM10007867_28350 [Gluconobacter cerinus]
MKLNFLAAITLLALAACSGNVSADHGHGPKPPPFKHARYEPGAAYGSARAVWAPPVYDRQGHIVKVEDPRNSGGREDYEHAAWAVGDPNNNSTPSPGTF